MNDTDPAKRPQTVEDDFPITIKTDVVEEPLFQSEIDMTQDAPEESILAQEVETDVSTPLTAEAPLSDSEPQCAPADEPCPEEQAPATEAPASPSVPAEAVSAEIAALAASVGELGARLEAIGAGLEKRISEAAVRNELFDKLYADMEKYRNDIYAKLLKPFVLEAISILEDYRKVVGRIDTLTPEQLAKYLRNIPEDIVTLLENNGVDLYTEKDDAFNRRTQQIIKTIPTDDPALDGKVATRVKPGYEWNGTLLRQEKVEIYKLTPAKNN